MSDCESVESCERMVVSIYKYLLSLVASVASNIMNVSDTKETDSLDASLGLIHHRQQERRKRRAKIHRHVFFALALGAWFGLKWFNSREPSSAIDSKVSVEDASIAYPWSSVSARI